MKLSKSKINTYLKCPREFKFQYIDKIQSKPNEYMLLGSDVHLIAEKFIDRFEDEISNVNIRNELIKVSCELDVGYGLEEHVDNLSVFFEEIFIDFKLFSHEEYLFDEKNNFSGICDLILEDENGELVIIDYKTSNSNTFSKYRLELCYYKLLVENVFKRKVSKVGIFFTKNGRLRLLEVKDIDNKRKFLNETEINESILIMRDVRNKINSKEFPLKKQFLCKFCTYKHLCD